MVVVLRRESTVHAYTQKPDAFVVQKRRRTRKENGG